MALFPRNRFRGRTLIEPAYFALWAIDRELVFEPVNLIESSVRRRGGVTCTEGEHYLESRGHGSAAKPEQSHFFASFPGIRGLEIKRAEHLSGGGGEMTRMQEMAAIHRAEFRKQRSEVKKSEVSNNSKCEQNEP